jgi:hypothetical protein
MLYITARSAKLAPERPQGRTAAAARLSERWRRQVESDTRDFGKAYEGLSAIVRPALCRLQTSAPTSCRSGL